MIPTQDPAYTAMRLIRAAKKAGKPIRAFLGVNAKAQDRMLVAREDASGLVQAAPRETMTIAPDMQQDTLAAALVAVWDRLRPQIPARFPRTQGQRFNPGRRA